MEDKSETEQKNRTDNLMKETGAQRLNTQGSTG